MDFISRYWSNNFIFQRTAQAGPRALPTDAAGRLNVLRHDGHTPGVNRTEVRVFKQAHEVSLRCFLHLQGGQMIGTSDLI